jgi:hypothetical protein
LRRELREVENEWGFLMGEVSVAEREVLGVVAEIVEISVGLSALKERK